MILQSFEVVDICAIRSLSLLGENKTYLMFVLCNLVLIFFTTWTQPDYPVIYFYSTYQGVWFTLLIKVFGFERVGRAWRSGKEYKMSFLMSLSSVNLGFWKLCSGWLIYASHLSLDLSFVFFFFMIFLKRNVLFFVCRSNTFIILNCVFLCENLPSNGILFLLWKQMCKVYC